MSFAFVVPCHGRHELAAVCLRQLRRTCDALAWNGLPATAVVVAHDSRFEALADELDFAYVRQRNHPLGRRWNDGYERAAQEYRRARRRERVEVAA